MAENGGKVLKNPRLNVRLKRTRRERLKSALYLRLKKRRTFFEKKLEIFEFFSFRKCRIVPKNVKGGPLGFINIYSVAKYQKTRKGDSFETLKNFRKKSLNAEKKSNLLVSSGFVGYVKKVNKPGPAQVGAISKAQK